MALVTAVVAALAAVAGLAAPSPTAPGGQLERTVEGQVRAYMAAHGVPGCSVALGTGTRIVVADGYGRATPDRPATAATVYRIGSVSKQFTAALAILAQERRLSAAPVLDPDAPVAPYFPEAGFAPGLTVRHLLYHSSGLGSYTDDSDFADGQFAAIAQAEMIARIAGYERRFAPGTGGHYSNSNYYLLARLLERHHSVAFHDLLAAAITAPLGLSDTRPVAAPAAGTATGSTADGFVDRASHASWLTGAGDLASSVLDLARWDQALLGGALLSVAGSRAMFASGHVNAEPAVAGERLAAGWMEIAAGNRRRFYHQGLVYGFSSVNAVEPGDGAREGRFVVALCNRHLATGLPALAAGLLATL